MQTNIRLDKTPEGKLENGGGRSATSWRKAAWVIAVIILLLPLVAMQFTDSVNWDVADFVVFGALLFGACLLYELAARTNADVAYRVAAGVAIVAVFLLIWINGAVGMIGSEENDANLMYGGVLAIGFIGAIVTRFRPHGMALALFATALAQSLVAGIVIIAEQGSPEETLIMNGFFVTLFLGSAWLFHRAGRERVPANSPTAV